MPDKISEAFSPEIIKKKQNCRKISPVSVSEQNGLTVAGLLKNDAKDLKERV
mgnify:CR=1 FL=1